MRILIVDDDLPTVDVICKSIHWESLGIGQIVTAYDFTEAQNRIRQAAPDIVLCDIEMPRGSGLDLLRWIREQQLECEFIFLTCHANFDYAKLAIQYEAADYITKPFNIETTEATLRRVVTRMQYRRQQQLEQQAGARWQDEKQLAQAAFLHSLLFEGTRMDQRGLQQRFESLGFEQPAGSPVFLALAAVPQSRVPEGWKPELFGYALRNLAAELWGGLEQFRIFSYLRDDTHYCLAWFGKTDASPAVAEAACKQLCGACLRCLHCEATCYLSEQASFLELCSLREALEQQDRQNLAHRGGVLRHADLIHSAEASAYALDIQTLEQRLHQGNVAGIASMILAELQRLAAQKQLTPTLMHQIHQDVAQVIYTVLNRNGIQAHELFRDTAATDLDRSAERSVFDMTKWVSFAANRAVQCIKESQATQSISGRIEQYIRSHYMEHISYTDIAATVYLTPDYANRIFKEERGMSIKDYLNSYRIEQAKQLLARKNSNVSDVAAQVGLDNFSYFSTLFKKYTGCSPSEFRKKNLC